MEESVTWCRLQARSFLHECRDCFDKPCVLLIPVQMAKMRGFCSKMMMRN